LFAKKSAKIYFFNHNIGPIGPGLRDLQDHPPLDDIVGLGITIMDRIDGPFSLEIKDIGVINDRAHNIKECHAYETYVRHVQERLQSLLSEFCLYGIHSDCDIFWNLFIKYTVFKKNSHISVASCQDLLTKYVVVDAMYIYLIFEKSEKQDKTVFLQMFIIRRIWLVFVFIGNYSLT
jgi:hypothetical protein